MKATMHRLKSCVVCTTMVATMALTAVAQDASKSNRGGGQPPPSSWGGNDVPEVSEKKPAIERTDQGNVRVGKITIFPEKKQLTFPAEVNQVTGPIEVLIATQRGRLHESLLRTNVRPFFLQTALLLLGLDNGARLPGKDQPQGDLVNLRVQWRDDNGVKHTRPIEQWIVDTRTEQPVKNQPWVFVGSRIKENVFLADRQGNIALVYSLGETVLDIPVPESTNDMLFQVREREKGPGVDDQVQVIVTPHKEKEKEEKNQGE